MLKQWVIFNKLETFNSILNSTIDDFTPYGNLSYLDEHGEILHQTPMKEISNLQWYIQHIMDENENEDENPLNHEKWMEQTNWKFSKYVIHHKHSMTPEQLKQKPYEEIFKKQHEKLDIEEGESNDKGYVSSTSPEKSEQDSESDTSTVDEQEATTTETLQVHRGMNQTTLGDENASEAEDDTSEENSVYEIESHLVNGEQNEQESKILITNFEVKVENQKSKGSQYIQVINRYSNSRSILELTKKYGVFILIFNQSTVNGPLMPTTEIPNLNDERKSQY